MLKPSLCYCRQSHVAYLSVRQIYHCTQRISAGARPACRAPVITSLRNYACRMFDFAANSK
jgi:hypothetical protein